MYCVVEFVEEGTVQVVPLTWLNKKKDYCKWPVNYTGPVTNLIKNKFTPLTTWPELKVRFFTETRKYNPFN